MERHGRNVRTRARLLAERDGLLRTAWKAASRAIRDGSQQADLYEIAAHTSDVDLALTVAESENAEAQEIDRALEQIELGTYGRCRECGRLVGRARLEALPYATLCVRCQRHAEGHFMRHRPRPRQGRGARWKRAVDYEGRVKTYLTADEEPTPCRGQLAGR